MRGGGWALGTRAAQRAWRRRTSSASSSCSACETAPSTCSESCMFGSGLSPLRANMPFLLIGRKRAAAFCWACVLQATGEHCEPGV